MGSSRLAVFDLDGTLTRRDTFVPYVRGWLTRHPRRRRPLHIVAAIGRFMMSGRDRGRLKSDLIRACMAGATRSEVREWTAAFVAALDDRTLNPGALDAIARHRAAGDRLVLLSASVDLYVPDIGLRFGFAESICTGIAWSGDALDGALTTPNRRGAEKRRCIEALRTRFPDAEIAAYGNSAPDLEHLTAVEHPLLVNAGRAARRNAEKMGIPTGDWRNKSP
ncbi:MAG TPA: HAD-IB family phosphatase [Steroidobacteraceae bacterium]|nr:HAD-IB family phosphatase [Steroidobacteraceae bacterium]